MLMRGRVVGVAVMMLAVPLSGLADPPGDEAIAEFVRQSEAIRPLVETAAVQRVLNGVKDLPTIEPRTIWFRRQPRAALTPEEYQALPETEREGFRKMVFDTEQYYVTFYGTPLASMRAYDLAAEAGGFDSYEGRRILDIGYGSIGQLRLLARAGADAVGVDIEPALRLLYSRPGDQGAVRSDGEQDGSVRLVSGFWPRDVGDDVGGGYDLIVSKNTLKKGYVAPDEPQPPDRGVDLSVPAAAYVQALADALRPGGLMLIYNMGPAPGPDGRGVDDEGAPTYVPMADVRCPFPKEMWEDAGFVVMAYDRDDSAMIRRFGGAFGWDDEEKMGAGVMDFERDLFAMYTLVRKK